MAANSCKLIFNMVVTCAAATLLAVVTIAAAASGGAGGGACPTAPLHSMAGLSAAAGPALVGPEDNPRERGDRRPERRRGRPSRRPEDDGPRMPGQRPPFRPTPEQIDRILEFVEEYFPTQFDQLAELKRNDARLFERRVRRMVPRVIEIMHAMERDQELGELMVREYQLDTDIRQLARRYRASKDPRFKNQAREELRDLIEAKFNAQLRRQRMQIEHLERRIIEQRERLEKEAENRERIVNRRLNRLLAEHQREETPDERE